MVQPSQLVPDQELSGLLGHVQSRFSRIGCADWRTVGAELEDLVFAGIVARPFRQFRTIRVASFARLDPVVLTAWVKLPGGLLRANSPHKGSSEQHSSTDSSVDLFDSTGSSAIG